MSEQDKGPDVQTRRREAEGLGLNDPRLHRPQQQNLTQALSMYVSDIREGI